MEIKTKTKFFNISSNEGFTLLELMTTLAVLAIIVTMVGPTFSNMKERHKVRGAAETVVSDLHLARLEAIKANRDISLSFQGSGTENWCYGVNDSNGCDCTIGNNCQVSGSTLRVTNSNEFSNISLATTFTGQNTTFEPNRGTTNSGTTTLNYNGKSINITLNAIGRIALCSNDYGFYPNCP